MKRKALTILIVIILIIQIILPVATALKELPNMNPPAENNFNNNEFIKIIDAGHTVYAWIRAPSISLVIDLKGKPNVEMITLTTGSNPVSLPIKRSYDLWRITLLDGLTIKSTMFKLQNYTINNNKILQLYYKHINDEIYVKLTFAVNTTGIYTNLTLEAPQRLPVDHVSYLILGGIQGIGQESKDDNLAIPLQLGLNINNPLKNLPEKGISIPYPSPLSMQFLLLYDTRGGLYYGVHDSRAFYKILKVSPYTYDSNLLRIWWDFYPNRLGNIKRLETPTILLAAFKGDWHCGAQIYAKWALYQWFTSNGTVTERYQDTWIANLKLWLVHNFPDNLNNFNINKELKKIEQAAKTILGHDTDNLNNIVVDLWNWNKGGFDNDYPEFLPSRIGDQNMTKIIEKLHSLGAKTSVYLNGRLVDIDTKTFLLLKNTLPHKKDGSLYIEKYGEKLVAAVAHPASESFRRILVSQIQEIINKYKIDIVFLDQVAIAAPVIDYGNSSISLLAGDIWYKSYYKLIRDIQNSVNKTLYFAVEGVSEVYIPVVTFYWINQTADIRYPGNATIIPLFNFIYKDYVILLNLEPIADAEPGFYRYIVETNVGEGYIPRFTTNVVYLDYDKKHIISEILNKNVIKTNIIILKYGRNAPYLADSICEYINYRPKHLVVRGIAKTSTGERLQKEVWKPSITYYIHIYQGGTYLYIYKYDNVKIQIRLNHTTIFNSSNLIIIKIENYNGSHNKIFNEDVYIITPYQHIDEETSNKTEVTINKYQTINNDIYKILLLSLSALLGIIFIKLKLNF